MRQASKHALHAHVFHKNNIEPTLGGSKAAPLLPLKKNEGGGGVRGHRSFQVSRASVGMKDALSPHQPPCEGGGGGVVERAAGTCPALARGFCMAFLSIPALLGS